MWWFKVGTCLSGGDGLSKAIFAVLLENYYWNTFLKVIWHTCNTNYNYSIFTVIQPMPFLKLIQPKSLVNHCLLFKTCLNFINWQLVVDRLLTRSISLKISLWLGYGVPGLRPEQVTWLILFFCNWFFYETTTKLVVNYVRRFTCLIEISV